MASTQWTASKAFSLPTANPTAAINGMNASLARLSSGLADVDKAEQARINEQTRKAEATRESNRLQDYREGSLANAAEGNRITQARNESDSAWRNGGEEKAAQTRRADNYNTTNKLFEELVASQKKGAVVSPENLALLQEQFPGVTQESANAIARKGNNHLDVKTLSSDLVGRMNSLGLPVNTETVRAAFAGKGYNKLSADQVQTMLANLPGTVEYSNSKGGSASGGRDTKDYRDDQKFMEGILKDTDLAETPDGGWLFGEGNPANKEGIKTLTSRISRDSGVPVPFVLRAILNRVNDKETDFSTSSLKSEDNIYKNIAEEANKAYTLNGASESGGGSGTVNALNADLERRRAAINAQGQLQSRTSQQRLKALEEAFIASGATVKEAEEEAEKVSQNVPEDLTETVLAAVSHETFQGQPLLPEPNHIPIPYNGSIKADAEEEAVKAMVADQGADPSLWDQGLNFLSGGLENRAVGKAESDHTKHEGRRLLGHYADQQAFADQQERIATVNRGKRLMEKFNTQ